MGVDAWLFCSDCNVESECLGRAHNFNDGLMNKIINDHSVFENFIMTKKRFVKTIQKDLFSDIVMFDFFEEIDDFYLEHKNHTIWLINDFFENGETK